MLREKLPAWEQQQRWPALQLRTRSSAVFKVFVAKLHCRQFRFLADAGVDAGGDHYGGPGRDAERAAQLKARNKQQNKGEESHYGGDVAAVTATSRGEVIAW